MWADDIRLGLGLGLFSDLLAHVLRVVPSGAEITPPEYFIVAQAIAIGILWARGLRKSAVNPSESTK